MLSHARGLKKHAFALKEEIANSLKFPTSKLQIKCTKPVGVEQIKVETDEDGFEVWDIPEQTEIFVFEKSFTDELAEQNYQKGLRLASFLLVAAFIEIVYECKTSKDAIAHILSIIELGLAPNKPAIVYSKSDSNVDVDAVDLVHNYDGSNDKYRIIDGKKVIIPNQDNHPYLQKESVDENN